MADSGLLGVEVGARDVRLPAVAKAVRNRGVLDIARLISVNPMDVIARAALQRREYGPRRGLMGERVEKFSPGTIQRAREGSAWIVLVRGDHDLSTAPCLVDELEAAFDAGAPVVVDLAEVAFMDSAILNALLAARERALGRPDGSFALVAPPGSFPSRVLALVVGTLIPTYPNLAAAVAAVAPTA